LSKPGGVNGGYVRRMTSEPAPALRPQPLIVVADVPSASRWYQDVLGVTSGHGGDEYEQLLSDGHLILQLHRADVGHHHGGLADPQVPLGNGVALWFEVADFDAAVLRLRQAQAQIVTDEHRNPNAGHREIWIRDRDGYLVVLAGLPGQ
jgi:catechol 2,3-dioxygenase-like lactoylglutathione lyase family enzyme